MGVEMFHHGEILQALSLLCQGAVRLRSDAELEDTLQVGSNRLFPAGTEVEVTDDSGVTERRRVQGQVGLEQVVLTEALTGSYHVAKNAVVKLVQTGVPELAWIGQGKPAVTPRPMPASFPCIVVAPVSMEQPLKEGTNRAYTQEYLSSVYYVRRRLEGEVEEQRFQSEVGGLFNLLMGDPYLGGTCWYGQVTRVDYRCSEEPALHDRGSAVRVARLEVLAKRSEVWGVAE